MLFAVVFMKYSENWRAFFDGGERIELFARKEDSTYLRQLAEGITDGTYVNERMKQAYDVIKRFVDRLEDNARHAFIDSTFTRLCSSIPPFRIRISGIRSPEPVFRSDELRRCQPRAARSTESQASQGAARPAAPAEDLESVFGLLAASYSETRECVAGRLSGILSEPFLYA